jgi:hypothetical protein
MNTYSVSEHISQSAHETWNFVCMCEKCDGYFIKIRKSDVPIVLAKMGYEDTITEQDWKTLNHRLVLANKK